eukprot:scaffold9993_cov101-Isochrysis_galbana.AAC.2
MSASIRRVFHRTLCRVRAGAYSILGLNAGFDGLAASASNTPPGSPDSRLRVPPGSRNHLR